MNLQQKINHQITAPTLRVLDEAGVNIGVMTKEAALKIAVEKNLDLIEVAPQAAPPIARIMSFDKFRYEASKKRKEERARTQGQEFKQVQISARSAKNDLDIKARKADEFLGDGSVVTLVMVLRGREKGNKDWAKAKLAEFLKMLTVEHRVISDIQWGGRGLNTRIVKK